MNDVPAKLHPSVDAAMGNISAALNERDALREQVVHLTHKLAAAEARSETLEGVLARTTADKDYYMRYCSELFTQLRSLGDGVYNALELAEKVANDSREPPENINHLRRIAAKFAPKKYEQ